MNMLNELSMEYKDDKTKEMEWTQSIDWYFYRIWMDLIYIFSIGNIS